jgi:excisionase family DNA binding protein
MDSNLYTVDEIAGLFHLHTRTVRRFIKEGRLKASKIGGQWRIREQDLREIIGEEPQIQKSSDEIEGLVQGKALLSEKIQVSTVIDILVVDRDEADRLSNCFIAVLNCKDPDYGNAKYNYIYYEAEKKGRFILWGKPKFIEKMLGLISEISK